MKTSKTSKSKASKEETEKFKFLHITNIHSLKKTEIYEYIIQLHELLKKANKKLRKYKEKLRKKKRLLKPKMTTTDASSSPDTNKETAKAPDNDDGPAADQKSDSLEAKRSEVAASPLGFIEEIKQAAENAQKETGFVYEPTSGLYYDCKTGYYYNAEHGLYYDGNSGCYYKYDQTADKFEFHSQVYADQPPEIKEPEPSSKKSHHNTATKDDDSAGGDCSDSVARDRYREDRHNGRRDRKRRRRSDRRSVSSEESNVSDERSQTPTDDRRRMTARDRRREKRRHRKFYERRRGRRYYSDSDDAPLKRPRDREDGECGTTESEDSVVFVPDTDEGVTVSAECVQYEDVATRYPPSLRIVVQETNLLKLKVGELFIITYKGGSLGREGSHDVIIPDINVSKFHLKFNYNEAKCSYECVDLGSRNGTVLNGLRMASAKQESKPMAILHGSRMRLSQTILLFHIHDGHSTCDACEPGLLLHNDASSTSGTVATTSAAETVLTHKQELKMIKKRYGLADEKYLIQQSTKNDRAAQRRKEVGSSDKSEKTQIASMEANIPVDNKGFKMLSKLGWSQGQKLGKNESGLLEPIALVSNTGTTGLGCSEMVTQKLYDPKTAQKTQQLRITQERYNRAEAPTNIFIGSDASD